MRLYRLYVFRKKNNSEVKQKESKVTKQVKQAKPIKKQKGGNPKDQYVGQDYAFNDAIDILSPMKFIKREIPDNKEYSFLGSVHDILKTQKIIPDHISMIDFYKDISFKLVKDSDITDRKIAELNKNLVIKHDYSESEMSSEVALEGMNVLVVKKDCDGGSVVDSFGPKGKVNTKVPSAILYHDGNAYFPIYKSKDNQLVGMFDTRMRFVKDLIDNKN
jgi:hypothetical protein